MDVDMPTPGSPEHKACVSLVYKALALSMQAKGTMKEDQIAELKAEMLKVAKICPSFVLAVGCWLRNKKEVGNKLIPTQLLIQCTVVPELRPFVRAAAPKILLIPSDLIEACGLARQLSENNKIPACMRKAACDIMGTLTPYSAAKYDTTRKRKTTKAKIDTCKAALADLAAAEGGDVKRAGGRKDRLNKEKRKRELEKTLKEKEAKFRKLADGDLRQLIRTCHIQNPPDVICGLLRKKYPESAEAFKRSGLSGDWSQEKVGSKVRLPVPVTWDRELSEYGNCPNTWQAILEHKTENGMFSCPYMALLRNMRNILLMGLPLKFLQKYVFDRLVDLKQLRGSGQTPTSLGHCLDLLEKEFDPEKRAELKVKSTEHIKNIFSFYKVRDRLCADIIGRDEKITGLVGEYLGKPIWATCGLFYVNGCFLASVMTKIRGSTRERERKMCIPLNPPDDEIMSTLKATFTKAIQLAAEVGVAPIKMASDKPTVVWMDVSNPPLALKETGDAPDEGSAPTGLCGVPKGTPVIDVTPGMEVTLNEITTHQRLNLELNYFAASYIDYNLMAYDKDGKSLWNSTFSNMTVKNKNGENVAIHCRDICGNPSSTKPATRTLHLDMSALEDNVFAMLVTAQNYSGTKPKSAAVTLRECHCSDDEFKGLHGGHNPDSHDCKAKILLGCDLTAQLNTGERGGTAIYGVLYRSGQDWLFRNILDQSLEGESRMAHEIEKTVGSMFKKLFAEGALASTVDPNRVGFLRLCQLYQALKKNDKLKIVMSGIPREKDADTLIEVPLTGNYMEDVELCRSLKKKFTDKAVPPGETLQKIRDTVGSPLGCVVRVANNAHYPADTVEALRKENKDMQYACIDMKGHIFEVFHSLPLVPGTVFLPGANESCLAILRNALIGGGDIVSHVDSFFKATEVKKPEKQQQE
eukprot:TRINITY_DN67589_c4_g1_i2.p1 TRINITY_DN67589_c4_g1~~TRINITY_DN67589_c4_g1_i2.p1  ORF type:complete len:922 (-),score=126.39 TRINITY_DN67589_c4_g1_i2:89-2854(-)